MEFNRLGRALGVAAVLLLGVSSPSSAEEVTFYFQGLVTQALTDWGCVRNTRVVGEAKASEIRNFTRNLIPNCLCILIHQKNIS